MRCLAIFTREHVGDPVGDRCGCTVVIAKWFVWVVGWLRRAFQGLTIPRIQNNLLIGGRRPAFDPENRQLRL